MHIKIVASADGSPAIETPVKQQLYIPEPAEKHSN